MDNSAHFEEPELIRKFQCGHDATLTTCEPSRQHLFTGSQEGNVTLYAQGGRPRLLGVHKGPVTCIRATADLVVSASVDKSVVVWHHQRAPSSFKVHFKPVRACDLAGDRFVLSASDDKLVKVSSLLNKSVSSYVGHTHWVRSAAFSPDATSIVSGSDDRTVRVWDVDTRQQVRMWCQHTDTVRCVRFNSKANVVVTCSEDSTINIWDVRAEVLRQHYNQAHGHSPIVHVALHPTRDLVLSASALGLARRPSPVHSPRSPRPRSCMRVGRDRGAVCQL